MKKATKKTATKAKVKGTSKKTTSPKVFLKGLAKNIKLKIDKEKFRDFSKPALKVLGLLLILLLVDLFVQYLNNDYSVAIVNGQRIPRREYLKNLETMYGQQVAEALIEEELVRQLGIEKDIKIEESEIEKSYNEIAEQLGGQEALEQALVANNMTQEQLRSQLKNELVLKTIIAPTLEYTDEDLLRFFEQYKETLYQDTTNITFEGKREEIEKYYIDQKTFEGRDSILNDFRKESTIQTNVPGSEEEVTYGIFKATRNLIRNFIDRNNTN